MLAAQWRKNGPTGLHLFGATSWLSADQFRQSNWLHIADGRAVCTRPFPAQITLFRPARTLLAWRAGDDKKRAIIHPHFQTLYPRMAAELHCLSEDLEDKLHPADA